MSAHKEITLDDAIQIALAHMNSGNFRVAELTLRDILSSVPDHYQSMFLLGMALYHMGNLQESLPYLKQATESDDVKADWLSNYGVILNDMGRHDEAIEAFTKAEKRDKKNASVMWNKCYALWLAERYKEAEKAGRKAVKLAPDSPEAWLNLGAAVVKLGNLEEAAECWEKALKIRPDFAFAWNNLGNVLRDLGKLKESEEKCKKALAIDPNYVEALNNLGNVYLDQGKYENAEEFYRRAIANKPDYAEAHNNLCVALMQQSRYDEAVMHGRYATSFKANYTDAYINLSDAMRNLGHIDEARKAIEKAVILRPDSAEVHMDLADVLLMQDKYGDAEVELKKVEGMVPDNPRIFIKLSSVQERAGKLEDALATVEKAARLNPEMPEAYLRKGQICHINNRISEAEENFNKALKLAPRSANAHLSLADLYLTMGEMKKTEKLLKKAKELAPNLPGMFYTLSSVKKFTKTDPDFKQMVALEKRIESYGLDHASALNFALFSAYEDMGNYKKAFEHLKKGNDYKRKTVPHQPERIEAHFQMLKRTYTPELFKSLEGKGYKSKLPVFIVGMPRSGTTLTEQIISSHPDVYGAGELSVGSSLEHQLGPLSAENCRELGALYVKTVKKLDRNGKAKRITDKMPGNFMNIGLLVNILPEAKIIHCRRNPIDTCLSCYKQNFARGQYWSYNLEELAEQYKLYEEVMAYWREVLPDRFLEIDYEDTVNNLEEQAHKLIDFVGLPWHKACLQPHKQKRAVLTASKTQVIKPVYKSSVKAWKRYEKQLEPLIKGLDMDKPPAKKTAKKTTKKTATKKKPAKKK
ncbi:MAG: tetratricopeptide repeat protein [Rhodospirillales bacterium]|nr:tetratricopeptide repeat protein [Rhodospirillales bacterium]MCB9994903.1 tetratricopeptide repeat protein [Rhodospirillales bacterium]